VLNEIQQKAATINRFKHCSRVVSRIPQYRKKVNENVLYIDPFHTVSLSLPMNNFGFVHFANFFQLMKLDISHLNKNERLKCPFQHYFIPGAAFVPLK
jgi:hypothetical protein